ncbi:MAG: HAD hydrolase family protein [Firmicutes bacterium]|nr:HAD hydrolase family protein [Bacillota bacterium]MCM1401508.1 HAD hydrolase family protein [Bacteroides sp.]MCM1477358.1 HAD hydrolase family protein [Bacteroides sp.]
MSTQLFITDMDGTLLGADSLVSPTSARIISELTSKGALITVATARTPATVEPLLEHVSLTPPAIVMTGAALWDRSTKRFLNPKFMDPAMAESVKNICHAHGLRPMTYTLTPDFDRIEMYVCGTPQGREKAFIAERSNLALKQINFLKDGEELPRSPRTILILAIGPLDNISSAARELESSTGCSVSAYPDIFDPSTGLLEVFAPGVSKAGAVIELKEMYGADELTVFGDNLNDLPMMRVANKAIAVENAMPQVRAEATEITGPNTADSVARYIARTYRCD